LVWSCGPANTEDKMEQDGDRSFALRKSHSLPGYNIDSKEGRRKKEKEKG